MARINLLPWRETARQQRRQTFGIALGIALGITFAAVVMVHLYFEGQITDQQGLNRYLESEIAKVNTQIKEIDTLEKTKSDLLARMEIIQQLQKSRPEIVRLFDDVVTTIPEGVYLTKIEQSGRTVTVEGRAQSNARVSAFMRRIESAQSIGRPRLLLIENKERTDTGLSHFRLSFDQIAPADEADISVPVTKKKGAKTTGKGFLQFALNLNKYPIFYAS